MGGYFFNRGCQFLSAPIVRVLLIFIGFTTKEKAELEKLHVLILKNGREQGK